MILFVNPAWGFNLTICWRPPVDIICKALSVCPKRLLLLSLSRFWVSVQCKGHKPAPCIYQSCNHLPSLVQRGAPSDYSMSTDTLAEVWIQINVSLVYLAQFLFFVFGHPKITPIMFEQNKSLTLQCKLGVNVWPG